MDYYLESNINYVSKKPNVKYLTLGFNKMVFIWYDLPYKRPVTLFTNIGTTIINEGFRFNLKLTVCWHVKRLSTFNRLPLRSFW